MRSEPDPGRQPPELPEVVAGTRFRRKEGLTDDHEGKDQNSHSDRTGERPEAGRVEEEGRKGGIS